MLKEANICQVAIVSKQAKLLRDWYCHNFGFIYSNRTVFAGPLATRVQGVPKDINFCYWAIDGKRQFQLEFFNFISPNVTPKSESWQPYDHGYNIIGIHTWDFEQTLTRLKCANTTFLSTVKGSEGQRWVMVIDPDGNHIEITEQDPLTKQNKQFNELAATLRYIRMSVPDIEQAQQLWQTSFNLTNKDDITLPTYHDQILFSEQAPKYQQCLLQGQGVLLELRQYSSPVPTPRLNTHNVTDQGIMNIAIGADSVAQWNNYFKGALSQQCKANGKPLDAAIFKVMYVNEPNLENIEILYPRPWAYSITGFNPSGVFARSEIIINTNAETLWPVITEHDNASNWAFFSSKLTKAGDKDKNGLNATRQIGLFGLTFSEKITNWIPNKSYSYQLQSKILLRNHQGIMHLTPCKDGVKLSWCIRFDSPLPGLGAISNFILNRLINNSLKKLKNSLK